MWYNCINKTVCLNSTQEEMPHCIFAFVEQFKEMNTLQNQTDQQPVLTVGPFVQGAQGEQDRTVH